MPGQFKGSNFHALETHNRDVSKVFPVNTDFKFS